MGMLKKAASGVLALLPCSRTECTLRASKELRPSLRVAQDRTDFFDHSLRLLIPVVPRTFRCHRKEIFNRPIWKSEESQSMGECLLNV
jgi:hypothetical protein